MHHANALAAVDAEYYSWYAEEQRYAAKPPHYLALYKQYLAPFAEKDVALLELGVFDGHSLEYYSRLLPQGRIMGLDINPCTRGFSTDRVAVYQGSQDDAALHRHILAQHNREQFDIIIDDCSHIGSLTSNSFHALFPLLAPGGLYIIEDWGTGYFPGYAGGKRFNPRDHLVCKKWALAWIPSLILKIFKRMPNRFRYHGEYFKSHRYGIPGFIKQLVDEVGMAEATGSAGIGTNAMSRIEYLHVYPGVVVMQKRRA